MMTFSGLYEDYSYNFGGETMDKNEIDSNYAELQTKLKIDCEKCKPKFKEKVIN